MEKATAEQYLYDGEDYEPSESEAGGVTIDGIVAQETKSSLNPWRNEPPLSASTSGSTTPTPRQHNDNVFKKIYPNKVQKPTDEEKSYSWPRDSLKHLECWFWHHRGQCKWSDSMCLYSHVPTGKVAGPPNFVEPGRPAVAGANARSRTPVFTNWREKKNLPSANHLQSVENAQSVGYAASAQDEPSDHAIRFDSPKKFAQPMEPEKDPQQPRGFQQTQNMQQFQNGQPFQYMQSGQDLQFDNLANLARLLGANPNFQQVRSMHPENNKYLNQNKQLDSPDIVSHVLQPDNNMQTPVYSTNGPQQIPPTATTLHPSPHDQTIALAEHLKRYKYHFQTLIDSHHNGIQDLLGMQLCDATLAACPNEWRLEIVRKIAHVMKEYRDLNASIGRQVDILEGRREIAVSRDPAVKQEDAGDW